MINHGHKRVAILRENQENFVFLLSCVWSFPLPTRHQLPAPHCHSSVWAEITEIFSFSENALILKWTMKMAHSFKRPENIDNFDGPSANQQKY